MGKIKKTEYELVEEQKNLAKMKIVNSLLLAKLAKDNNIKVEHNEIEEQLEAVLKEYGITKENTPKDINIKQLKSNIFQKILNEKIFTQILDKYII